MKCFVWIYYFSHYNEPHSRFWNFTSSSFSTRVTPVWRKTCALLSLLLIWGSCALDWYLRTATSLMSEWLWTKQCPDVKNIRARSMRSMLELSLVWTCCAWWLKMIRYLIVYEQHPYFMESLIPKILIFVSIRLPHFKKMIFWNFAILSIQKAKFSCVEVWKRGFRYRPFWFAPSNFLSWAVARLY